MKIRKQKKRQAEEMDIDLVEELEYYTGKKTSRKRSGSGLWIGIAVCVVAVAAVLFSPLFSIRNIEVKGLYHYSQAEILEKAGISTGDSLIFFGKGSAEKALLADPYIAAVQFVRIAPHDLQIEVTERQVRGYVPYMGSYLYIDEYGRVLDVQEAYHEVLPLVEGLDFAQFQRGEILSVENEEALRVMVVFSQMMIKYEMLDLVVELDVTDPEDVYARINQVEIHLGDTKDVEQKMRIMAQIVKTIPEEDRGTLDLSDLTKPIIFQYLT